MKRAAFYLSIRGQAVEQRMELRTEGGTLLGVLVGGTALEIKRGARLFAVDLYSTLVHGAPVILERVLYPEGAPCEKDKGRVTPGGCSP